MDTAERRAWAYLSRVCEPPNPRLAALVHAEGPVAAAQRIRARDVDGELARATEARHEIDSADADLDVLDRLGGRLLTPGDDEWPHLALASFARPALAERPYGHPPLVLWAVGPSHLADVTARAAALVGTRAASAYGEHVTSEFAAGLVERDVAVISGGAYGIDGAAHRTALACDGETVAVLAAGIDVPYPSGHSALLHRIGRSGLVLTEYPPGMRPSRRQFLARNRLVAALSGATVVLEAGVRSGAANTAAWARALGRQVCAVPGPVTSASSAGCHIMIANHTAWLVTRAAEVVEAVGRIGELAPEPDRPTTSLDDLDDTELTVYEALPRRGARTVGEIAVRAGLPVSEVLGPLAMLDLRGLVSQEDGNWKLVAER
ncbi:DNA-protecting protein DprA [Mycolicibacterium duvalii]|uniref:Putative DNA processing protein DprA n=1 Tax=Mycolicibacterium duvalii TaxID=39688 RepID=A0A7I7K1J8_9MYCO|nr:DNA-processing protein DprA [Mycolicibacterium duvalii]MCV7370196.1 DNA-protecting protein DprA [Mycolicibacterium duvalii]PEG38456.1 DNA-protecting protein DprA [Mycolicibacterium duvalii]BBX17438.1 putative DNA processing protein DprA [Mycolicibacterium duvalii]